MTISNSDIINNNAVQLFYDNNPFVQELGISIVKFNGKEVILSLKTKHEHLNVHKTTHGGVLMSLADTSMGATCFLLLKKRVVTLDFNINMIKAVPESTTLTAKTTVIHNGQRTIVTSCSIFDRRQTLCCQCRATMFVLGALEI